MEDAVIDTVSTPRGELQLRRRAGEYEIISNGIFIMATYNRYSERELATLPLSFLPAEQKDLKVLVGGLGIGYTLQAALADQRVGRVDVAEIEPQIVSWNREYLGGFAGSPLEDPRVRLLLRDVAEAARQGECYHVIALDVDNGPEFLLLTENAAIYRDEGLVRWRERLEPQGVLAIWSAQASEALAAGLQRVFGNCTAVPVAREDRPELPPDYIYLVRRE